MRGSLRGSILLAAISLSACATQPHVDAYVTNILPMPSTLFEQRVKLDLRLQNTHTAPISAQGIDVRVIVNGRQLARGVTADPIQIEGLSDATTTVVVSSRAIDTVRQVLALPNRQTFSYRLKGRLITQGFDKRFSHGGEFSRKELGTFFGAQPNR